MVMRKYKETVPAGGAVQIEHKGRNFVLLRAITPVTVQFMRANRVEDEAQEIESGITFEPEGGFEAIRIVNPSALPVVVEFLAASGPCAWVQPPPSTETRVYQMDNLPITTSITTDVIDLGDAWASCLLTLQTDGLTASAGGWMRMDSGDNSAVNPSRLCVSCISSNSNVAYLGISTSNHHLGSYRPTGRFVRGVFMNGAVAQGVGARMIFNVMRNIQV